MASEIGKSQPLIELNTELLAAALKSSAESILIKDCNGTILLGSQGVANFYGCSVEELPGIDAYSALPPNQHEVTIALIAGYEASTNAWLSCR